LVSLGPVTATFEDGAVLELNAELCFAMVQPLVSIGMLEPRSLVRSFGNIISARIIMMITMMMIIIIVIIHYPNFKPGNHKINQQVDLIQRN
jgi:hypothetical protein